MMTNEVLFLILGSALGFLSSIGTTWFQHRFTMKQLAEERRIEQQSKTIEDSRRFLESKGFVLRSTGSATIALGQITTLNGSDHSELYSIKKNVILVGSSETCDFVLGVESIAEIHLRLIITDEASIIEDVSGTLEAKVNNTLLTKPQTIHDGDTISIGDIDLKLNLFK